MTQTTTLPLFDHARLPSPSPSRSADHSAAIETLQSRFALRVASRLTERAESVSPEISERLRFAREQALQRARATRIVAEPAIGVSRGAAILLGRDGGQRHGGWWLKFASVLPVFALVGGLVMIEQWQDNTQISVAADIDAGLLSDDLPPTAYSDAGFAEFLKNPSQ